MYLTVHKKSLTQVLWLEKRFPPIYFYNIKVTFILLLGLQCARPVEWGLVPWLSPAKNYNFRFRNVWKKWHWERRLQNHTSVVSDSGRSLECGCPASLCSVLPLNKPHEWQFPGHHWQLWLKPKLAKKAKSLCNFTMVCSLPQDREVIYLLPYKTKSWK